ncbi:MAG: HI1506-related protein [Deltaproteobacteria bacterium]|nr:HI1506-related protein [Deltaproteobacteria bacterium]
MPIRITAKQEGFRRCGIAHSMAEVEYQDDQFTEEQLAYLQAEPMLVVEMVKETKGKPGKSGADNS